MLPIWAAREAGIYRLEAALAWSVADKAGDAASALVWRLLARALTRAQKAPAARVLAGRAGAGRAAAGGESAAQSTQPALRRLPGTDVWAFVTAAAARPAHGLPCL